jgi:hypothetical protein
MSNVSSLAAGGQSLVNTAIPGYQGIYQAVQANPYYSGAMAGAQQGADNGQAYAGSNYGMAQQLQGFAQPLQGYQQNIAGAASGIGGYQNQINNLAGQVAGYQQNITGQAAPLQGYQQALSNFAQPLQGYSDQIAQTAFDPQNALYNRNYQQQMDQQNAINAMYGVAGSPYGAGVAGQTSNNFNIDWQNAQLARQAQGATAIGSLGSTMGNAYGQAAGIGGQIAGLYGQAANVGSQAAGLYDQSANLSGLQGNLYGQAANMGNTAAGIYGEASNLNQQGLDVAYQTSQLPNSGYMQQMAAQQAALDALVSGTSGAYNLTQGAIGDYGNYLKIGQSATANAQNAAQMNNQSSGAGLAGLGKLAGAGLTYFGGPAGAAAGAVLGG